MPWSWCRSIATIVIFKMTLKSSEFATSILNYFKNKKLCARSSKKCAVHSFLLPKKSEFLRPWRSLVRDKSPDIVKNAEKVFSRPELSRKHVFEMSRLLPLGSGFLPPRTGLLSPRPAFLLPPVFAKIAFWCRRVAYKYKSCIRVAKIIWIFENHWIFEFK